MKRLGFIFGALAISVVAGYVYLTTRVPSDITPQNGDSTETVAWVSLAIAVSSLLTAVVGLVQKLIELRAANRT